MMISTSPWLGGLLLIAAGIFQFTPLKNACLHHCRTPLDFLMTEWREGPRGALVMGLRQGFSCTICCWLLMALLFVLGVMNLWWVAAITAFVLIEKLAPRPKLIGRLTGCVLLAWHNDDRASDVNATKKRVYFFTTNGMEYAHFPTQS